MCSSSATGTSLVVAITAQRLHSKVRDRGSGKNLDFGDNAMAIAFSQTGHIGTIIVECSAINSPPQHPAAEVSDPAAGLTGREDDGIIWGTAGVQ